MIRRFSHQHGRASGSMLRTLLGLVLVIVLLVGGAGAWWVNRPLDLQRPAIELSIEAGDSPRQIARAWVQAGVQAPSWLLYEWFRWSGQSRQIRAGSYMLEAGATPLSLLRMMVQGDERLAVVRLIEGWTFKRFRAELALAEGLKPTTTAMSDSQIMAELGQAGVPAEGQFYPDTYSYAKGSTDLAVLQRAHRALQRHLAEVWLERAANSPLRSPQDLLTLASIVEKETGREADRALISGVFSNRLRIGMPLQTDPSVIYGLGDRFDGNLRRSHLQADTPYNTYTRAGLPPSPISMPGKAALMAAARPADTAALYFVARGDGSSTFSKTLAEHNRAVNQYQRNQGRP